MNKRKPAEYSAFEQLTKRLLVVPKSELDKQVDHYNARKAKRNERRNPTGEGRTGADFGPFDAVASWRDCTRYRFRFLGDVFTSIQDTVGPAAVPGAERP